MLSKLQRDKVREKKYKKNESVLKVPSIDIAFPCQFLRDIGHAIRWLQPKRAIIFGSAVKTGLAARDIDILILADSFRRFLWQDRPLLLCLPPGPVYDVRLFTPTEFETLYPPTNPIRQSIENQNLNLEKYYA